MKIRALILFLAVGALAQTSVMFGVNSSVVYFGTATDSSSSIRITSSGVMFDSSNALAGTFIAATDSCSKPVNVMPGGVKASIFYDLWTEYKGNDPAAESIWRIDSRLCAFSFGVTTCRSWAKAGDHEIYDTDRVIDTLTFTAADTTFRSKVKTHYITSGSNIRYCIDYAGVVDTVWHKNIMNVRQ